MTTTQLAALAAGMAAMAGAGQAVREAGQPPPSAEIAPAEEDVPRQADVRDVAGARSLCLPADTIAGAKIVALGAYEGGTPTQFGMAGESHEVGAVAVAADRSGPPLILVLSAYDPVIWDFSRFPLSRLKAILVYGYHSQAVAHVPARIPVRFVTRANSTEGCGKPVQAYEGGPGLERLAAQTEALLGSPIAAFHGGYDPSGLHADGGTPVAPAVSRIRVRAIRSSAPIQRDEIWPGEQGLMQLIQSGAIRPARPDDVEAWNAAATRHSPTGHLAPARSQNLSANRAFVVLRRTPLPKGMYGAHARSFIIPAGVPPPTDPGSHNSYYWISDGSCRGAIC